MATDPRGEWAETALDLAVTAWDVGKAVREHITDGEVSDETREALVLDVVGAVLPGVTALTAKSVGRCAIAGFKAARSAANAVDRAGDMARGVERGIYWVAGATVLKSGRELSSVFCVDADSGGELLGAFWWIDGYWYSQQDDATLTALG
jgi:hypothetical protein